MFENLNNPAFDGKFDPLESKIENTPENYAHQIAWDAELLGYSPLAQEPNRSRLRRALGWLGRALVAYDPNGNPIF